MRIGRRWRRSVARHDAQNALTFARQGNVTRSELVDLHGVIRHIVDTQHHALSTRGVRVLMMLAPTPVYVQGDTARLEQVMLNLVANARQALEAVRGERAMVQAPLELRITTEIDAEAHVMVRVADNGAGISPSLLGKIWDPFFTTKEEGVGTGLGLSVVHSIVTEHGGVVDVHSEMGRGTEFTVRLPTVNAPDVEPPVVTAEIAVPGPESTPIGRALDILVVDDEAAIISFLTRFLTSRGHAVVGASDGMRALRIAEQVTFDVVICDLYMPEMDGVELIRRMRMLPTCSGTRYVMSSGDGAGLPMMGRTAALDADGLLAKPYTIDELVRVVSRGAHLAGVAAPPARAHGRGARAPVSRCTRSFRPMASPTEGRHVPINPTREGWPYAIATTLLAVALYFGAWSIHKATYRDPTDPMFEAKGALPHTSTVKPAAAAPAAAH